MTARSSEIVRFGPFRFTPDDGLRRGAVEVPLPPRALGVLTTLLSRPGLVVSKQELMDAVWPDSFVTESSLLEAVGVVRDAMGDDRRAPKYIQTVHRRGYRFVGEIESMPQAPSLKPTSFFVGPEWRPIYAACISSIVATVAIAVVFAAFGQRAAPRTTSRFSIALPTGAPIDPLRGSIAVSPDGSRIAYVANGEYGSQLFLRTVDRDEPSPIDGTDNAASPFFSPDGEWIGFFAKGSLQRVRATGGVPLLICPARAGAGATWSADGTIVFGGGPGGGLARVSAAGGEPVVLAIPEPGTREVRYGWPDQLPGGRGILFTSIGVAGSDVRVLDQRTGHRATIVTDAAFGRYSPTGHVIFEQHGRLEAASFSLASLAMTDSPRPIVSSVSASGPLDGPRYAFSQTGALMYVPRPSDEAADAATSLDSAAPVELNPTWRPNGIEIAFAFAKAGPFNLFMKPADGSGIATPLVESPWNQFPTSWAPDARHLAFTEFQPLTGADIWVIDVTTRERRPLVRTLFDETWARFSPDGQWVAYMSNESGRWEIYVRDTAGAGLRLRVSSTGGVWPWWSGDGQAVYFNAGNRTMAAALRSTGTPAFSSPVVVRETRARLELRVVLGWFSELTRLVQAG